MKTDIFTGKRVIAEGKASIRHIEDARKVSEFLFRAEDIIAFARKDELPADATQMLFECLASYMKLRRENGVLIELEDERNAS